MTARLDFCPGCLEDYGENTPAGCTECSACESCSPSPLGRSDGRCEGCAEDAEPPVRLSAAEALIFHLKRQQRGGRRHG